MAKRAKTEKQPKGKKSKDKEPDDLQPPARDEELCGNKDIQDKVKEIAKNVAAGFVSQDTRANDQLDYWDIYDCLLTGRQSYAGNSQIFVPIINEAIEARVTRFVNQMFPRSSRNIDCVSSDDKPYDLMALLEHYTRRTKLRTQIMPALIRCGDVEGHYNLYVGWENSERHIVTKKSPEAEIKGEDGDDDAIPVPTEMEDDDDYDVEEETTYHMGPTVEVLPDTDILVLPHTANSIPQALAVGGSVTIIRRWSKSRLERAIDDGEVDEDEGEALLGEFGEGKGTAGQVDAQKAHVCAAGIQTVEGQKVLLLYEIWSELKIGKGEEKERRLCKIYYAGTAAERIASVKRNPNWNDKCPLLSAPVKKINDVFKGQSQVKFCADLQYAANDACNMGWDSAQYALLPIIMTDPTKNPRVGSMILNLAAIWETNPNDTQFAKFPPLWKDALALVAWGKTEIFQKLSVSPAIMPQSSGQKGSKRNQAEVAQEQQVDILSTADSCTILEDEILTPLLRWMVDLDYQHRDKEITVRQYGQMGLRANMQVVKPLWNTRRYEFRWFGIEAARSAQQTQLQIAAVNVVRGIPEKQYEGYKLNVVPMLQSLFESAFGPRVAPEVFKDIKSQLTVEPQFENELLMEGMDLPVHVLDDDKQHMEVHIEALKHGDPTGSTRQHMLLHRFQMQQKMQMEQAAMAQMQQQQRPGGQPGVPGGGPPGVAGTPRGGAMPGPPRGGQQPPGAIHQDRLVDASAAPRR